ncbi:MAG TPA: PD-(D/E)XK nuclease family protein [Solirubrobacteraceae bacterium]
MPASKTAAAPPSGPLGGEAARVGGLMKRPEVRDVLAWLRLLVDPQDAAAVVRALARPPIGLRQVDLARVIQVARRRKLDLVLGLAAATESPQVPPEARERIQRFVELHRAASAELETLPADEFLARLIERLGAAGSAASLLAPDEIAERRESMRRLVALAGELAGAGGPAGARELARHLATVLPRAEDEEEGAGAGAGVEDAQPGGAAPGLSAVEEEQARVLEVATLLREELLEGIERIGGRLGELRFDTDLDISHGVVRYLELLKVAALMQRPPGQELADALSDVNARLLAAATPLQREILETSTLDESLLSAERSGTSPTPPLRFRDELSLRAFLPRRGGGLALSASDIQTYRSCPLRYKFARVLRIPTEQTIHQRFGIVVHQVLERYHSGGAPTLHRLLELLDAGWRRAGLDRDGTEGELLEKARTSLVRYHERLQEDACEPVWFERPFSFRIGPHHLRGRVDRVDRLPSDAGGYELIDYKTSRPKTPEQLRDDVQLSLYALAAREDWALESSRQAYYYVLDDEIVPVPCGERDADAVEEIVMEVGEGILAQDFEPTPSQAACSICDYRIVCPAAL